jgi:hypothetical protein
MPSCADTALSASHDSFEQVCSFLGDREAGSLTHGELEPGLTVDLVSWFGSSTKPTWTCVRSARATQQAGRSPLCQAEMRHRGTGRTHRVGRGRSTDREQQRDQAGPSGRP